MDVADDEAAGAAGLFGSIMTAAGAVEVELVLFFSAVSATFLLVAGPIVQAKVESQPGRRQRLGVQWQEREREREKSRWNGMQQEKTKRVILHRFDS